MILVFLLVAGGLILAAWLVVKRKPGDPSRRRATWLLTGFAVVLWLLNGFILTNPYGSEISSSLPAFLMLPLVIAGLMLCLIWVQDIARLWTSERTLAIVLVALILALCANFWRLDALAFYVCVGAGLILGGVWWLGMHLADLFLGLLSLLSLAIMIFASGAFFYTPGLEDPAWVRPAMQAVAAITSFMMITLAATQVYLGLRGEAPIQWRSAAWRLGLALILVLGSSLYVFWDGVWSSAHARAYEDHLPLVTTLFGLVAGILLALTLAGWRRMAGVAFTLGVMVIAVFSFNLGWNTSAVAMTNGRAAKIEQSLAAYYQEHQAYPDQLSELTPDYMLYLPPPAVVRQGNWCYLGGAEGYRLGYVSGDFTYFNSNLRQEIYSQAGEMPLAGWSCTELISEFEAGERNY